MKKGLELQPILLTTDDVARMLQVTPTTVRAWTRDGKLPKPFYISTRPRWNAVEITEWLSRGGTGA